jgi:hypothetical protein
MRKQKNETQDSEIKKYAVNFLIAEYSELNQEFRRLREEGLNRLNFFIAITSSVLGGLVLLSQSASASGIFLQVVALGALFFLVLIGWDTFRFTISRDESTDKNIRRMGRIRRFFEDEYPPIEKYLPWQSHDEPTSWVTKNTSAIRQTSQSIISLLLTLMVIILVSIAETQPILLGVIGIVSFIIIFALLGFYAKNRYKKATVRADKETRFPNKSIM